MNTANPPVEAMAALLGTDTISKGRELTFKVERLRKVAGIFEIEGGPVRRDHEARGGRYGIGNHLRKLPIPAILATRRRRHLANVG
jgi:hypothetical protein